jgi:hypothetical protein
VENLALVALVWLLVAHIAVVHASDRARSADAELNDIVRVGLDPVAFIEDLDWSNENSASR